MKSSIAKTQYAVTAADLHLLLALARGGTLAQAAARIGADASTVFRGVQRIEKSLGQRLFERTREGYLATDSMLALAVHAERIETELEAARTATASPTQEITGRVRLTTVDAVLRGLVLPHVPALGAAHPKLQLELRATNELLSLTKRDADVALRAVIPTSKPPDHLVGRHLGPIRFVVCAPQAWTPAQRRRALERQEWVSPEEAMPDHPSVRWRRKHLPKVAPRFLVDGIVGVIDAVRSGVGVGIVPLFALPHEPGLAAVGKPLEGCESQLWLLAHPESRHLRRIAAVYQHFADAIQLP